jgi:hypothetical protein
MSKDDMGWSRMLREPAPRWPHRGPEPEPGRQRWLREPEPFEDRGIYEPYPGATVIEDMAASEDGQSSLRVLARYTVIRVLILGAAGRLRGPRLRTEQRIAREHLALLPRHDWERHALDRLTGLCNDTMEPAVIDAAIVAAESAAKREHVMGALGLYRAGYELARDSGWWEEAARASAGIARLARLSEAPRSARVWRWRTNVMDVRAKRRREAEAAAAAALEAAAGATRGQAGEAAPGGGEAGKHDGRQL